MDQPRIMEGILRELLAYLSNDAALHDACAEEDPVFVHCVSTPCSGLLVLHSPSPTPQFVDAHAAQRREIMKRSRNALTFGTGVLGTDESRKEHAGEYNHLTGLEAEKPNIYPLLPPVLYPGGKPSEYQDSRDICRSDYVASVRMSHCSTST